MESRSSKESVASIIEFQPQYTEEIKKLARAAMENIGLEPSTVNLYLEDDFDYENILQVYKNRSRLWIALEGGRVVGTVAIQEKNITTARLRRMFVAPDIQGEGIGQRLLDVALKFAKENRYEKVLLNTDKLMNRAQRLYEKNGFHRLKDEGERIFYEKEVNGSA